LFTYYISVLAWTKFWTSKKLNKDVS